MTRKKRKLTVKSAFVCALAVALLASMTVFFSANAAQGDTVSPTDEIVAEVDGSAAEDGEETDPGGLLVENMGEESPIETDTNPYGMPAVTIVTSTKSDTAYHLVLSGNGEIKLDMGLNEPYSGDFYNNGEGSFITFFAPVVRIYGDVTLLKIEAAPVWNSEYGFYEDANSGITSIDVSNAPNLESLECPSAKLTSLDVSACSKLSVLNCSSNNLTKLDLSHNPLLTSLDCYDNAIAKLDLSNHSQLTNLNCCCNNMTSLSLPQDADVRTLYCIANQLTSLNVANYANLEVLCCNDNNISSLDVRNKSHLVHFECNNNNLRSLDLTGDTALERLSCPGNKLEAIDVSAMPNLYYLDFSNNALRYSTIAINPDAHYGESTEVWEDEEGSHESSIYWVVNFAGQKRIAIPDYANVGQTIDLSAEFIRYGEETVFTWYDESGSVVEPVSAEAGVFIFGNDAAGKTLYCKMSNARYINRLPKDEPQMDDFDNWDDYINANEAYWRVMESHGWQNIMPASSSMVTSSIKILRSEVEELTLPGERVLKMGMSLNLAQELSRPESLPVKVIWKSSSTKIATVSSSGVVKAVAPGKAVITAKCGTETATCTVVVEKAVVLNKYELTLTRNHSKPQPTTTLAAKKPSGVKTVFWKSDNPQVVTVDKKGKLTAISEGTANITCDDINGGALSNPCTVTVKDFFINADSEKLINNVAYVLLGEEITFDLIGETDQPVVWKTGNAKTASVVENSTFFGKAKGSVNITVQTADRKFSDTVKLNVVNPTVNLTVKNPSVSVYAGAKVTLKTAIDKNSNDPIFWSSENEKVATVDAKGNVTGVSDGVTTINARTFSGATASATVTVRTKAVLISWFDMPFDRTVSKAIKHGMRVGDNLQLAFDVTYPANCTDTCTWSSSNKKVATVEPIEDGRTATVTAVAKGTATITVKTGSGKKLSANIYVTTVPAEQITLNKTDFEMYQGSSVTLTAKTQPKGNNDVILWRSTNTWAATVDENGKVTGKHSGEADIVAYSAYNGDVTATAHVLVRSKATKLAWVEREPLPLNWGGFEEWEIRDANYNVVVSKEVKYAVKLGETKTFSFEIIAPDNCNDKVTWSTSDKKIATVNPLGYTEFTDPLDGYERTAISAEVTGIKKGTVTLTAKTGGGKKLTAKVTVVPVSASQITINKKAISVYQGSSYSLAATVLPKGCNDVVRWVSLNPWSATVDENGRVKALNSGYATIAAYSATSNEIFDTAEVIVRTKATGITAPVTSVTVEQDSLEILTARVLPYYCNDSVTWTTSDKKIVSIISTADPSEFDFSANIASATIVGLKPGIAYVTAKTGSGKAVKIKVVVTKVDRGPDLIRVWASENNKESVMESANKWLAEYNAAHPDDTPLRVKVSVVAEDIAANQLLNNPAVGADVLCIPNDQIDNLVANNAILALPDDVVNEVRGVVGNATMETVRLGDHYYGAPFAPNTAAVLYYNKSMLTEQEAGNLNTILSKCTLASDIKGSWFAMNWFATAGGRLFTGNDPDVNTLNSEDCTKMIQWLMEQNQAGKIIHADNDTDLAAMMRDGYAGACIFGPWAEYTFREALGDDLGILELPVVTVPDSNITNQHMWCFGGSKLFAVNAASTHPEAALSLMQYLNSPQAQLARYQMSGTTPTAQSLLSDDSIASNSCVAATLAQNDYTVNNSFLNNQSNYWSLMYEFMTRAMSGDIASEYVQDELDSLVSMINSNINGGSYSFDPRESYDPNALNIWGSENDNEFLTQAATQWASEYNAAHSGQTPITVKVSIVGEDVAADTALEYPDYTADVFSIPNDHIIMMADHNAILSLPTDAVNSVKAVVGDTAMNTAKYDSNYYGAPFSSYTADVLYYNKRMFTEAEAGNLNTMLEKDLGNGVYNLIMDYTSAWDGMTWYATAGAQLYTANNPTINTLNSADSVKMIQWLIQQQQNQKIMDIDSCTDAAAMMGDGHAAACIYGPWADSSFREALGDNLGILELPTVTVPNSNISSQHMRCFSNSKLYAINANAKYPEASLSLLQYLTSADVQLQHYQMNSNTNPTAQSLRNNNVIRSNDVVAASLAQYDYSITNSSLNNTSGYWDEMSAFMTDLVNGEVVSGDVQNRLNQVVANMQARVNS